jgi:hypothetical protein
MQKLKYLGVPIFMNNQNYYIPSLSIVDFRANYEMLTAPPAEDASPFESFDRFMPVIGLAIRRNYPEITDENLAEWLDMTTFQMALEAVRGVSGIVPVSEGE